jgi:hypothetical protein
MIKNATTFNLNKIIENIDVSRSFKGGNAESGQVEASFFADLFSQAVQAGNIKSTSPDFAAFGKSGKTLPLSEELLALKADNSEMPDNDNDNDSDTTVLAGVRDFNASSEALAAAISGHSDSAMALPQPLSTEDPASGVGELKLQTVKFLSGRQVLTSAMSSGNVEPMRRAELMSDAPEIVTELQRELFPPKWWQTSRTGLAEELQEQSQKNPAASTTEQAASRALQSNAFASLLLDESKTRDTGAASEESLLTQESASRALQSNPFASLLLDESKTRDAGAASEESLLTQESASRVLQSNTFARLLNNDGKAADIEPESPIHIEEIIDLTHEGISQYLPGQRQRVSGANLMSTLTSNSDKESNLQEAMGKAVKNSSLSDSANIEEIDGQLARTGKASQQNAVDRVHSVFGRDSEFFKTVLSSGTPKPQHVEGSSVNATLLPLSQAVDGAPLNNAATLNQYVSSASTEAKEVYSSLKLGPQVVNAIYEQMTVPEDGQVESVRLEISPENLGDIEIEARRSGTELSVRIVATNEQVAEALREAGHLLKDLLANSENAKVLVNVDVGRKDKSSQERQSADNEVTEEQRKSKTKQIKLNIKNNLLDYYA